TTPRCTVSMYSVFLLILTLYTHYSTLSLHDALPILELAVRTSSDPSSLVAAVRNEVHELDKDQSVADIRTLDQVVSASLAQRSKDRKSTRLNSSHVEISYAVFCLKKKNNITFNNNNI